MVNWVLLMHILLCLYFSADTWFLSNRFICIEEKIFSGHVSTRTLAINFDLVKCIIKININSYPIYNEKVEGGLSPER